MLPLRPTSPWFTRLPALQVWRHAWTLAVLLATTAGAQTQPPASPDLERLSALRMQRTADLAVTGSAFAAWGASELLLKSSLASPRCGWCAPDLQRINRLDRFGRNARWDNRERAALWSNIVAFGALPLASMGTAFLYAQPAQARGWLGEDVLIIGQSVALAGVLNQAVKFSARRERPFVAALREDEKGLTDEPLDNNLSFYSGHTSFAFSLAVSTGTVASLRGYRGHWLVWAAGLPVAASVGYLRMAADKHYLSDVLVGAVVGSAVGAGVPLLLHPRTDSPSTPPFTLSATPRAVLLQGTF